MKDTEYGFYITIFSFRAVVDYWKYPDRPIRLPLAFYKIEESPEGFIRSDVCKDRIMFSKQLCNSTFPLWEVYLKDEGKTWWRTRQEAEEGRRNFIDRLIGESFNLVNKLNILRLELSLKEL